MFIIRSTIENFIWQVLLQSLVVLREYQTAQMRQRRGGSEGRGVWGMLEARRIRFPTPAEPFTDLAAPAVHRLNG